MILSEHVTITTELANRIWLVLDSVKDETDGYHRPSAIEEFRKLLSPPLQLKEGCWYERRDGKVVGPVKKDAHDDYQFSITHYGSWTANGKRWTHKDDDYDLIREVPAPVPKYRPFKNADEFKPHADKWIRWDWKGKVSICRVAVYGDDCLTLCNAASAHSWTDAFNGYTFLDGTPFGVKVDE